MPPPQKKISLELDLSDYYEDSEFSCDLFANHWFVNVIDVGLFLDKWPSP